MIKFEISAIIDRPVEIVTEALNIPENFPYWQTDLERFEVVKRTPEQTGSVARLHYRQRGRTYIMEDKMIYCEPGRKYISEVSGSAIAATVETTLESLEGKTKISLKWAGSGKILPLKLLLPLFRGKMIKQSQKELDTFKHLIETRGTDFSKLPENR